MKVLQDIIKSKLTDIDAFVVLCFVMSPETEQNFIRVNEHRAKRVIPTVKV